MVFKLDTRLCTNRWAILNATRISCHMKVSNGPVYRGVGWLNIQGYL